ncbi:MAG: hypothetical protein NC177_14730 [Ruminococcus flavefaciens]|nr:hypothetical protein [Ruminococcus flavefaciens]
MLKKMHISLTSLKERGVHTDMFDETEDSFFKDTYEQAFRAVHSIHHANMKQKDKASLRQQVHDIQNVIVFTGRRGTGKTSAMLTFANALHDGKLEKLLSGTKSLKKYRTEYENGVPGIRECKFYALPYVDASLLAKTEDLFIVVLSKMLDTLNEFEGQMKNAIDSEFKDNCLEKLRKNINDVYNQYVGLKGNKKYSEAFSYQIMVKNAQKHNLRESFKKLIEFYIDVWANLKAQDNICHYSSNRKDDSRYLVICIDDIDMAQNDVMEIMSCIYTYFMLPNVIVLTTLNFKLLSKAIEKYYYNTLAYGNKTEEYFSQLCKEQTNDYLRKIISSDMRIVMPSWKKSDYREFIEMKIDLSDGTSDGDEAERKIEEMFPNLKSGHIVSYLKGKMEEGEKTIAISPKELILLMLADRTGIYLDAVGFKLHFMEPDSLRNMVDLFNMFYNMENPRVKTDDEEKAFKYTEQHTKIFRQNIKIIMDYFYFKLVPDFCLSYEEEMVFHQFYTAVLSRRAKRIITYYRKKLEQSFNNNVLIKDQFEDEKKLDSFYNYGEMFRVIHHASRLEIMSKEMIKAILACYSFILPRIFDEYIVEYLKTLHEQINENNMTIGEYEKLSVSEKCRKLDENKIFSNLKKPELLYKIFGNTLPGNWNYDLFSGNSIHIKYEKFETQNVFDGNYQSFESVKDSHLKCMLSQGLRQKIGEIADDTIKKIIGKEVVNNCEVKKIYQSENDVPIYTAIAIYEMKYDILHLIYSLMLYPLDYSDKPNEIVFSELKLDPTAFVINVSRYREFFDWLTDKTLLKNLSEDEKPIFRSHCNYVKDRIEHYVLSQKYPHFVLPLHQTDLVYNVIKRSVGEIVYSSDFLLERKEKNNDFTPEETIKRFYENIRKELHREDEVYTNANRSITYEEQFVSCPVVQHFLYLPNDNKNKMCIIDNDEIGEKKEPQNPSTEEFNAIINIVIDNADKRISVSAEEKTEITANESE